MNATDRRQLDQARQLLGLGKVREALAHLMHLTEKYPDDGEIRTGLAASLVTRGAGYARHGELDKAATDFERSIRYSETAEAHVNLGRVHQVRGQFDEAFAEFTKALDLDENLSAAHEALGHYFVEVRDFDQASKAFDRAISKGVEDPASHLGLWQALTEQGRHDQAHEALLEASERWPGEDTVMTALGLSFANAKGDPASAEEWWKRALSRNPSNLAALFNLAALAATRDRREEALDWIRRCVAADRSRTLALWKQDASTPPGKFASYVSDEDFLDALGFTA